MREPTLRSILLIRAIEDADPDGGLLPAADRVQATREALREAGSPGARAIDGRLLERLLADRAQRLRRRLEQSHPAVARLASAPPGGLPLAGLLPGGAFLLGAALATLDGSRQVDLLAFPLAGLVAWNLLVYLGLALAALRRRGAAAGGPGFGLVGLYAGAAARRVTAWLARASEFDAALGRALVGFAREWRAVLGPWLAGRARALLHFAAAAVALGLVAGLYFRGLTLEYRAAWESTFLAADGVRVALAWLYGPASALTGLPLPANAIETEALRRAYGGVPAAPWLHLMAATVVLYVIVPRLLLAIASGLRAQWRLRHLPLPATVHDYGQGVLRAAGLPVGLPAVEAIPCGRALDGGEWAALERLCARALGSDVVLHRREVVRYGAEAELADALAGPAPLTASRVLAIVDLAATPEDETHGALLRGLRDAAARRGPAVRLAVLLEAGGYARRMDAARVAERVRAWERFVTAQGLPACRVDLARAGEADASGEPVEGLRRALANGSGQASS
ncbi:MAG: DUF2868 domain-containing protein [Steroidobacteraceae bacterium]|jgi:hypothetical protein|nr:DUF2868 domain-containing protein [Steroidobacteraceae bacterium]